MNEVYKKHRVLIKLAAIVCCAVIALGIVLVVDSIQKAIISANSSEEINISENHGEINAYNVEGLTDEQIEQLLEIQRNNRRNK